MSPTSELHTVDGERPESSARRAQRVLSDRSSARRKKLVAQLVEPGIVAEDVELLTHQANDIYQAFKPRNGWQDWLTSTIATIMIRINRCERIERKLRDLASYRAIDFWEDDQILEVETLASKIDRDPAQVVAKLRQTPSGLDWLLRRWRFLARLDPQGWTDEQRALAERMVGGDGEVDPSAPGFAAEVVAELEAERTRVEEADAIVRGLVEADLSDDHVPGLAKLRRYARSLHRQLKWYVDQFHIEHPDRWDDPRRKPAFEATNLPAHSPTWSFAESESRNDKTNPFSAIGAEPGIVKTNPILPEPQFETGKTNPIGRAEVRASLVGAVPETLAEERVVVRVPGEEVSFDGRRKRRVDPARELARRQKTARRRRALLCESSI